MPTIYNAEIDAYSDVAEESVAAWQANGWVLQERPPAPPKPQPVAAPEEIPAEPEVAPQEPVAPADGVLEVSGEVTPPPDLTV